jgi:hypothetical protein
MRLPLLLVACLAPLSAADVTLTVGGLSGTGTRSYAWSVVARPFGAELPTLPATTTTGTTTITFVSNAVPGTYIIQAAIRTGTAAPVLAQTHLQVTRRQTTTFPTGNATFVYDPDHPVDIDPGATTNAPGLKVAYSIQSGTAATIIGNRIRPLGLGTVVVRADVAPHVPVRYRPSATPVLKTFTLVAPSPMPQVISVPSALVTLVKGTRPSTAVLGATATSGLPLTYTTSAPSVATVTSSGTVSAVAPGSATITITQPGTRSVAPALPVTVHIDVVPASIAITAPLIATPSVLALP